MKLPKFVNKAAVALKLKEPPRRRGLGKKTLAKIEQRQMVVATPQTLSSKRLPNGKLLLSHRAYKEVAAVGGVNSDWAVNALSEDSDVWQNQFLLRQRSRDLFRTDAVFCKYREELWANSFGANGITLRMDIKEEYDRPVKSMRERAFRRAYNRRKQRVHDYLSRKYGNKLEFRAISDDIAQAGEKDVYSNYLIEEAWKEWQRREFCTMANRLSYQEVRFVRLLSAARDGDFFIRHVKNPKVNKFGYSLHLINSEWCDFYFNTALTNGNEVRMGIERDQYGKNLMYYFIKRQPMDWQYAIPGAFNYAAAAAHQQIPADQIIHYARYVDGDSTRPAPWSAPVIPKSRHLDKYEEAEVVSARVAACKMGFLTSNLVPEGGFAGELPDPTQTATLEAEPGAFEGLPWGVGVEAVDFKHPNQNFPAFRKEMLRAWCAGMPGANYNIIANDLEGVNYSSGRLGMLDERELWKVIQNFDIDIAERPIFENWLEMSLMTGALPLSLTEYDRLNRPIFRGRRWAWVDPLKEVQASALQVANKFTSRTRIIEDSDVDADFEQILFELAEEEMLMEELGMDSSSVIGKTTPQKPNGEDVLDGDEESDNEADGSSKALSQEDFERQLQIARAGAHITNVTMPNITMPPVEVYGVKQEAPVVKFEPRINVPSQKTPELVVNVAAPNVNVAAPEVKIANQVNVPSAKTITVKRGDDGKLSGLQIEKE